MPNRKFYIEKNEDGTYYLEVEGDDTGREYATLQEATAAVDEFLVIPPQERTWKVEGSPDASAHVIDGVYVDLVGGQGLFCQRCTNPVINHVAVNHEEVATDLLFSITVVGTTVELNKAGELELMPQTVKPFYG